MQFKKVHAIRLFFILSIASLFTAPLSGALPRALAAPEVPSGISEYYIPGYVNDLFDILDDIESSGIGTNLVNITTISVGGDITLYYDHWENGYGTGATGNDETYTADKGDILTFRSNNVPDARTFPTDGMNDCTGSSFPGGGSGGAATRCYDGADRVYVVGGAVSVAQSFWPVTNNTNYANAWEIYPVKPLQTNYTIPIGQNLYTGNAGNYSDFLNVNLLVMGTTAGTGLQINNGGVGPNEINTTIGRGQTQIMIGINAGTLITATQPVEVQYIVGNDTVTSSQNDSRSFTAVPSALWYWEYYSPVPSGTDIYTTESRTVNTDLFIYNPTGSTLTIYYEDSVNPGGATFTVAANSTESFEENTGHYQPADSALYLRANNSSTVFRVIGSYDTGHPTFNFGFLLLPTQTLAQEYFVSWAPGGWDQAGSGSAEQADYSPIFVTPTEDQTTIYLDYTPADGIIDDTFVLDRLEVGRIYHNTLADNTGIHVFSSAPIALVWGIDADVSADASPGLDAGYTLLPVSTDFVDVVINLEKTADPTVVSNQSGQTTTFTLVITTEDHTANDVFVQDFLPANWAYVNGSTTITYPNATTDNDNPAITGIGPYTLTWSNVALNGLDMGPNETLTIEFDVITTAAPNAVSVNLGEATGTFGGVNFTANDTAIVDVTELLINKSVNPAGTVYPGDTLEYTIVINNAGSVAQNNVVVNDPLPAGTTYVAQSTVATGGTTSLPIVEDTFPTAGSGATGTGWTGNWVEIGESDGFAADDVQVVAAGLRVQDNDNGGTGAYREVNLSSFTTAYLSFTYTAESFDDASDFVTVAASTNGGSSWTTLNTFSTNGSGTYSVVITSHIDSDTRIRFLGSPDLGGSDFMTVDNVRITSHLIAEDLFQTAGNGGTGTGWNGNWVEVVEADGFGAGDIQVVASGLRIQDNESEGAYREVNLSSFTTAYLSFTHVGVGLSGSDNVVLQVSTNGGSSWTTLNTFTSDTAGTISVNITPYIDSDTRIRLLSISGNDDDDNLIVDNVRIHGNVPGSALVKDNIPGGVNADLTSGVPPTLVTAADNFDLAAGQSLTVVFKVKVNDPVSTSLSSIDNTVFVTSVEQPNPLTDSTTNPLDWADIGNLIWNDFDGDGIQDGGEPGLPGVTVRLYKDVDNDGIPEPGGDDGPFILTTTTNASGVYNFAGLNGGGYFIVVVPPTGYTFSPQNATGDTLDSDVNASGTGHTASVGDGATYVDFDAGLVSQLDYGDLPASYNNTLFGDNGARHVSGSLTLGPAIDNDPDGTESVSATGDTNDDGVDRDPADNWTNGATVDLLIDLQTSGSDTTASVGVWIDWDGSGTFELDEFYGFPGLTVGAVNTVSVTVPDSSTYTVGTSLYARIRAFAPANVPGGSLDWTDATGVVSNGEVEDYLWPFSPTAITLKSLSASSDRTSAWILAGAVILLAVAAFVLLRKPHALLLPESFDPEDS